MSPGRLACAAALAPAAWGPVPAVWAQPARDASLRVTVRDTSEAVIVGAAVTLSREGVAPVTVVTNERGEALFDGLQVASWTVRASSPGFEPFERQALALRAGSNRLDVTLQIAGYVENVVVGRDPQEAATDPRGDGFTETLSAAEMDALPDDADELEAALQEMAGPGAVITVDGFRGGALPPKSQIQQIRFRRGLFSAQYHERGTGRVEIITRPGMDGWRSNVGAGFRDDAMNARNAFAHEATPSQQRRLTASFSGPIVRQKTSFSFGVEGLDAYESQTINAVGPTGPLNDVVRQPQQRLNVSLAIQHGFSRVRSARVEYQNRVSEQDNLGVGSLDLPTRAYSQSTTLHQFRFGDSTTIGKTTFNQLRAQVAWHDATSTADTRAPTLHVLDAFTAGGANVAGGTSNWTAELSEELEWSWGRHSLIAGGLFDWARYRSDAIRNADGTFTFSSLDDFAARLPVTFTQRIGDPAVAYGMFQGEWFVHDDMRLRKNLTVSAGLRHEWQSHLGDRLNIAPRAGVLWSPTKSGRTTVRGGAGINLNAPGADFIRPDPAIGNVIQIESIGHLRAHELTLGANGTLPWRGLFLAGRYTYGWSYDDGSGPTSVPADSQKPDEWGPSNGDVRHRAFVMTSVQPLARLRLALNLRAASAAPYTITTGTDDNRDGILNDRPAGVGRNSARGDGAFTADLRVGWRFGAARGPEGPGGDGPPDGPGPLGPAAGGQGGSGPRGGGFRGGAGTQGAAGGPTTEIYLQVFNLLNNVNPIGFSGVLTSPYFGMPTGAQAARRLELGMRVIF